MASMPFRVPYQKLSLAAAALSMTLFVLLLIFPGVIYWLFELPADDTADFMSRRAALLFLGLAVVAFAGRNEPNSGMRRAVSLGMAVLMAGLAGLGAIEFFRGACGVGIWLAVVTEAAFAIAYFQHSANQPTKA